MSVRPSTSTQFANLNKTFESDCSALEQSIRQLKEKAASSKGESSAAGAFACSRSVCDDARLASRAKDLRSMTEQVRSFTVKGATQIIKILVKQMLARGQNASSLDVHFTQN